jgi:multisubunit Na+/H+ antiporter MnhE subunit
VSRVVVVASWTVGDDWTGALVAVLVMLLLESLFVKKRLAMPTATMAQIMAIIVIPIHHHLFLLELFAANENENGDP